MPCRPATLLARARRRQRTGVPRPGPTRWVPSVAVKRFGSVVAVDDVTARVVPGQVTAFLGPNGAGKTTTLRMLLGLVRPTAGQALLDGRRCDELESPRRSVGAARSRRVPPQPDRA